MVEAICGQAAWEWLHLCRLAQRRHLNECRTRSCPALLPARGPERATSRRYPRGTGSRAFL